MNPEGGPDGEPDIQKTKWSQEMTIRSSVVVSTITACMTRYDPRYYGISARAGAAIINSLIKELMGRRTNKTRRKLMTWIVMVRKDNFE